jgi:hypothetical protein
MMYRVNVGCIFDLRCTIPRENAAVKYVSLWQMLPPIWVVGGLGFAQDLRFGGVFAPIVWLLKIDSQSYPPYKPPACPWFARSSGAFGVAFIQRSCKQLQTQEGPHTAVLKK